MKAFRVKINSWTSSFRYPNLISGFQPTLEVPPVSTVMGLIYAASGKYLANQQIELGYYFDFKIKTVDLETIYQIKA
ncbi:MAG: CRISPR-associated protein Cas5, partial [Mariniphaga sp.]